MGIVMNHCQTKWAKILLLIEVVIQAIDSNTTDALQNN